MKLWKLVLCGLLLLPAVAEAQDALVLSGGGSRGLAHAGVFIALEERGYDADIVVGTSMGAVVGALYAAGYEPEEIRRRLVAVNWTSLFIPTPTVAGPDRDIRYPMFSLDLDLAQLRVSRGLFGQWRINRALTRLLFDANARSRGDFDRLARRYRAVAADLKTGDAVVLDSGDIARAARASMAVPGFFAPVEWHGRTLVDGGIVDNVPTSVARALGAQRVVAVDVSRPPPEIHSMAPFAVIGRALDLMQENTQRDTVPPDVLVVPQIPPGATAAAFPADPTAYIDIGLAAGRRDLAALPVSERAPPRAMPQLPDSFVALLLEAPDSALAAIAQRAFREAAPGRYDHDAVLQAVDELYTTGLLEAVWPSVSGDTLIVRLDGPPPLSLAVAAHYESDRGGRGWLALDRYLSLARRPTVLTASLSFEGLRRSAALSSRVHSLAIRGLAWSTGVHAQERSVRFFESDRVTTTEVVRAGGWFGFELPHVLRAQSLLLNLRAEWIDVEPGAAELSYGPLLRWAAIDATERVIGLPLLIEAERRFGDVSYTRAVLSGSHTLHARALQVAPLWDLRMVSEQAPIDEHPSLGDEHAVPGLRWGEYRGAARALAGIDAALPIGTGFLALRLRSGAIANELQDVLDEQWVTGAQAAIVWPSPVGAVEVAYGLATRGDGRFDISVGRRF